MPDELTNAIGHARREPDVVSDQISPRVLATLCFTAKRDFLALVRSTTGHVAGLLGLPHDRAADLRLAVDEACALFVGSGAGGGTVGRLALVFAEVEGELRITVRGLVPERRPDLDGLGWVVLCALVGRPRWEVEDDIGTLTLFEPIPGDCERVPLWL